MDALLGPIHLLRDASPANMWAGASLCLLLPGLILLAILKPSRWSISIAALAVLAWLAVGVAATGINA